MSDVTTTTQIVAGMGLKERRRAVRLTRHQLAIEAECSPSMLQILEDGYVPTRSAVLTRVLAVLEAYEARA